MSNFIIGAILLISTIYCTSADLKPKKVYPGFAQFGNVRPTAAYHLDPIVGPDFGISDYKVYDYSVFKDDSLYSYDESSSWSDFGERYKFKPLVYAVSSDGSFLPRSKQRADVYYRRRPNVRLNQFCQRF